MIIYRENREKARGRERERERKRGREKEKRKKEEMIEQGEGVKGGDRGKEGKRNAGTEGEYIQIRVKVEKRKKM